MLWDRSGNTIRRIHANYGSTVTNPQVSGDGRYAVFTSFVPVGPTYTQEVFLWDRTTGKSKIISDDPGKAGAPGDASLPTISASGRYVSFYFNGPGLGPLASNTALNRHLFRYDRTTGKLELITAMSGGRPLANGIDKTYHPSGTRRVDEPPAISSSGSILAFVPLAGPGGAWGAVQCVCAESAGVLRCR